MGLEMTPKDQQILQYICEKFSCKICNNILMQCVTLSCGHHYCNYCLELLHAGMLHQCPQCSSPIHRAQPNNSVDQQIDNLINSCSESIQKSYASALNSRFQKSMERSKMRCSERNSYSDRNTCDGSQFSNCLDEIRNTLLMNDINLHHSVTKSLKSARSHHHQRRVAPSNEIPERQSSSRPRSKPLTMGSSQNMSKPIDTQDPSDIDLDKVNVLFGIYDHVLSSDNGNNNSKEMGGGDFVRDQDLQNVEFTETLDGMNNFTKRSEVELETLIKETDDIIRLDGHIQKWTNKMKEALGGNNETVGIADEKFYENVHTVDDELWKASNELLQRLQGMQKQRKMVSRPSVSFSCPATPLPRSYKPNFDTVSDDSDAEEYEHALETLQESLENSYDLTVRAQSHPLKQEEIMCGEQVDTQRKSESNSAKKRPQLQEGHSDVQNIDKGNKERKSSGNRSARKKSILDCMEESGHNYIKENIDFITKMRKYKEALMKIHNREVLSAQEIKELVPTRTFPSDGQDASTILKGGDATTPRRLTQLSQGSRRSRNHSYSARLPLSTTMERRPVTATYDVPSSQLIHKQLSVVPSKQYLKQRARVSNSLFTAR